MYTYLWSINFYKFRSRFRFRFGFPAASASDHNQKLVWNQIASTKRRKGRRTVNVLNLSVSMAIITQRLYRSPPHSSFVVSSSDALTAGSYTSSGCREHAGRHRNRARLFCALYHPPGRSALPCLSANRTEPSRGIVSTSYRCFPALVGFPNRGWAQSRPLQYPCPLSGTLLPTTSRCSGIHFEYIHVILLFSKNWRDLGSVGHTKKFWLKFSRNQPGLSWYLFEFYFGLGGSGQKGRSVTNVIRISCVALILYNLKGGVIWLSRK